MKLVVNILFFILITIYLPYISVIAAEKEENQFYSSENCVTFLSFWSSEGDSFKIHDKDNNLYLCKFQRFDTENEILYFIEQEFISTNTVSTINYSDISQIEIEKKKLNMGQIKQATIIGTLFGLAGGLLINKSQTNAYTRDNEKFRNIFLGVGLGVGAGFLAGLIGNDRISTWKILDCK